MSVSGRVSFLLSIPFLFNMMSLTSCSELLDVCLHESFNASCPPGEVVLMTSARYGRMRSGRCISADYGHIGCSSSVVDYLDRKCSGRASCSAAVRDLVYVRPCRKDFMSYLEAQFECIQVPVVSAACPDQYHLVRAGAEPGYLTGVGMATSPAGSGSCPWMIQAGAGQHINLTFIDFGRDKEAESTNSKPSPFNQCTITIFITELDQKHEVNVCGRRTREKQLFVSTTNSVKVEISLSASSGKLDFVIQCKAIGCTEPVLNKDMWMQRIGENAVVKCNSSGETWYLTCKDSTWVGDVGNCSSSRTVSPQNVLGFPIRHNTDLPSHAMVLAVLIGVVLGLFLGASLLIIVHRLHRKRKQDYRNNSLPLMESRDIDPLRNTKDLEGTYPALLGHVHGEGQTLNQFIDCHHICQQTTFYANNQFDQANIATLTFNDEEEVNNSGYIEYDSRNKDSEDRKSESPYPPGMRTPQRRDSDSLSVDISLGCHTHSPRCSNLHLTDKLNIACLPDSSFE